MRKGEISALRTDGGIPVLVEVTPSSESVAIAVYVLAGSRNEPGERAGTAHLLEHMMFRGTRNLSSKEISRRIEDAGGELNGFTTKEFTCYYSSMLRETFDTAAEILTEVVSFPALTEKSFGLEKQIVTEEAKLLLNDPELYVQYLFPRALWEGHPMSTLEVGDFETIDAISVQDLRDFYRSRYTIGNMVVVASGGVTPERVIEWASSLDDLPSAPDRPAQAPPSPQVDFRVFEREGDQTYVGMGFPGVPAKDKSRQAQKVLAALLGAGMSSRLFQSVREELGLVYSIFTTSMHYTDCGNMATYFSCSDGNLSTVIDSIAREFSFLKQEGLTPGELARSKRLIRGMTVRRLESTESRMFRIGDTYSTMGEVKPVEELLKEIELVTEDDVMSIAERILRPENLCVAIHGPNNALKEKPQHLDF